jgi:glycosyltransferase involved in cell wall biosynthesis
MPVSVVIPTFNCAQFLPEAIESVLNQTAAPHEIIVVDDGSTDDTENCLRQYAGRIRYFRKVNGGVSTARNLGIREATGDLIAFLDSDDVWQPQKLEIQTACLRKNVNLGILGTSQIDWPKERFTAFPEDLQDLKVKEVPFEDLVVRNVFNTSSVIVRKTVTELVGEFDSTLHGPEDYDYWLRCLQVTVAANLGLPLTGYRMVPGSLGKRAVSMETGMQRILKKLDGAGVWQGRHLLRRKAHAYQNFSCAYMYAAANRQGVALSRLIRSMAWYPWFFRRDLVGTSLARPKQFAIMVLRMLRFTNPETNSGNLPPTAVAH